MKKLTGIFLISFFVALFFIACEDKDNIQNPDDNDNTAINSCVGCHTNKEALINTASPDTAAAGGGCGGEAPHYDVWDRVILEGDGYELYKTTAHGKMECTECHNGVDGTDDKVKAHSNDFIARPSSRAKEKCGSCHSAIVEKAVNSIHDQGWGQKRKVTMRYGLAGAHEFDKLPEGVKHGYNQNCATCHGSCGECHVVRPSAGGGGLMDGHNFAKKPDMRKACITCHTSRGGHAYLGIASGTKPDIHQEKLNYECTDCHGESNYHGTGEFTEQRYAVPGLPACTDCHEGQQNSNKYHKTHWEDFACQTCHSQPYNNCSSCHIGGESVRVPSHQDFKIAMNPLKGTGLPNKDFRMSLVRQTPMAKDSWSKYGLDELPEFDLFPTWNYTSPHNIRKWTAVTTVAEGQSCYTSCHIVKDGDIYRNKHLYLFKSDLRPDEMSASEKITVDGKLPASWNVE